MTNTGIILTLAYPETIVLHAEEWYSPLLKYVGIGNKTHVRAGHAALVLIEKSTGILEYHDFGRYITPEPNGRVRGKDTDCELDFPIVADIENDAVLNLKDILKFLATHPKLTHGDGTLYASVCSQVDYKKARSHINKMQNLHFIRYAAFIKEACNCARFVTDVLIASITNKSIKKKLISSQWFTPSTIGNVVLSKTVGDVFLVSETGEISKFKSTIGKENRRLFLDRLKNYSPSVIGTLEPKQNAEKEDHAQWLPGIAAGAWFELTALNKKDFRYRRISPYGNVDVDATYQVSSEDFDYSQPYTFEHYSNCKFFHVKQRDQLFRFDRKP
ncbi:hypothetical protein GCM10022271_01450 [Corallibacter vietnamensis]|uniref:Uncharacterized protein n=1 Tax=Corallibacter vietnamensis TaxID=904130 RepID=A0ABP7GR89_9FLAO